MVTLRRKKNLILVGLILILNFLHVFYQVIFGHLVIDSFVYSMIRLGFYFILTVLCCLIAFTIGKWGIGKHDTLLLRYAYFFLLTGTVIFVLSEIFERYFIADPNLSRMLFSLGNIYFYFMHIYLIFRHYRRDKKHIYNLATLRKIFVVLVISFIVLTGIFILLYILLKNSSSIEKISNILFLVSCIIYAVIIGVAVFIAWLTFFKKTFKQANSFLIIIGYTSFLFCEIFTVFGEVFKDKVLYSKILTSVYYTPAFMFLALSGYLWMNRDLKLKEK